MNSDFLVWDQIAFVNKIFTLGDSLCGAFWCNMNEPVRQIKTRKIDVNQR
jgi:hypothetical protein